MKWRRLLSRREECGCLLHPFTRKHWAVYINCEQHGYPALSRFVREQQFGPWQQDEAHYPDGQPLRPDQFWRFDQGTGWVRVNAKGEIEEHDGT